MRKHREFFFFVKRLDQVLWLGLRLGLGHLLALRGGITRESMKVESGK